MKEYGYYQESDNWKKISAIINKINSIKSQQGGKRKNNSKNNTKKRNPSRKNNRKRRASKNKRN